jgi:DNA polymerase-3 subunit gamma/tau
LQEESVRQMLGSADRSHVFGLIDALAAGDGKAVVEIAQALRLQGLSASATLEDMSAVLQRMAVLQAVPDLAQADGDNDPERADIERLAHTLPADETQLLYSLCLHGRAELGLAPDEYAALTMVLLRLLAFKPATAEKKSLNDAGVRPRVPTAVAPAPVAAPAPTPAPAPAAAPSTPIQALPVRVMDTVVDEPAAPAPTVASRMPQSEGPLLSVPVREQAESSARHERVAETAVAATVQTTAEGDVWFALVQQLVQAEAITALVRELALQSQLLARDSDTWMLRIERESLNNPTSRERLQAALAAAGHPVRLAIEVGRVADSPALRLAQAAAQRQSQAEAIIHNDPYVQTLMRDFGARIVPGSIKPV